MDTSSKCETAHDPTPEDRHLIVDQLVEVLKRHQREYHIAELYFLADLLKASP